MGISLTENIPLDDCVPCSWVIRGIIVRKEGEPGNGAVTDKMGISLKVMRM